MSKKLYGWMKKKGTQEPPKFSRKVCYSTPEGGEVWVDDVTDSNTRDPYAGGV
jgi:hypothetical protein